jgi:hypothetical protein
VLCSNGLAFLSHWTMQAFRVSQDIFSESTHAASRGSLAFEIEPGNGKLRRSYLQRAFR